MLIDLIINLLIGLIINLLIDLMEKVINFFGNKYKKVVIKNITNIDILCNLIDGKITTYIDANNMELMYYFARYHEINNEFILEEKYHLIAIESNCVESMYLLANRYRHQEKYDLAKKYYLLAIENKHSNSMNNLAFMYEKQDKQDIFLAKKYYTMAIENNNAISMRNLAHIYEREKNYDLAEKYYTMAIKNNHMASVDKLLYLYTMQNKYDKILELYTTHNININNLVIKILRHEIKPTDNMIKLLRNFDIYNKYTYQHNDFDGQLICIYKIFKKINTIPKVMNCKNYNTYKIMMEHILPKLDQTILCKNIVIYICRKIFDN